MKKYKLVSKKSESINTLSAISTNFCSFFHTLFRAFTDTFLSLFRDKITIIYTVPVAIKIL